MKFGPWTLDLTKENELHTKMVLEVARKVKIKVTCRSRPPPDLYRETHTPSTVNVFSSSPASSALYARAGEVWVDLGESYMGQPIWDFEEDVVPRVHGNHSSPEVSFAMTLLHEIGHAATSLSRHEGRVGSEDAATAWSWSVALGVWGPYSKSARILRAWDISSGMVFNNELRFEWERNASGYLRQPPPRKWLIALGKKYEAHQRRFTIP